MPDASRAVGVASALVERRAARRRSSAEVRAEYREIAERRASGRALRAALLARAGAREPPAHRLGRVQRRRAARGSGVQSFDRLRPRRARPLHRLDAVLPHLGAEGHVPEDPRRPDGRRDGARACYRDAQAMLERIVDRALGHRQRGRRALARQRATATTSSSTPTTAARRADWRRCTRCASSSRAMRAHPNLALADFVAPRERGVADYIGAFAVTTGHGERERAEQFAARARRLQRDPLHGALRPPRRGVRRAHARARAARALGLRAGRGAAQRRADRRALPRHPARARLRLPARPHREAHDLRAARRSRAAPASSSPRASR